MNLLCKGIEIYELLRTDPYFEDKRNLREFVTAHLLQQNCIWVDRGREVVGAAFVWQIRDPNDVLEFNGHPGDDATGKYVHLQHVYIRPDCRDGSVLKELFQVAFKRLAGTSRVSFQRLSGRVRNGKRKPGRPISLGSRDSRRIHVLMFGGSQNGKEVTA